MPGLCAFLALALRLRCLLKQDVLSSRLIQQRLVSLQLSMQFFDLPRCLGKLCVLGLHDHRKGFAPVFEALPLLFKIMLGLLKIFCAFVELGFFLGYRRGRAILGVLNRSSPKHLCGPQHRAWQLLDWVLRVIERLPRGEQPLCQGAVPPIEHGAYGIGRPPTELLTHPLDRWTLTLTQNSIGGSPDIFHLHATGTSYKIWLHRPTPPNFYQR